LSDLKNLNQTVLWKKVEEKARARISWDSKVVGEDGMFYNNESHSSRDLQGAAS
jgi:hypothetical protein